MKNKFSKDLQYYKFCLYGFLKNLKFFEPFLILFFFEKGLLFVQIGILYGTREILTNLFEIPTGMIADSLGKRRSMIFSFISYIVSFVIFYLSSLYILFFVGMFFFSIGEAFRTGTHKALIFEYLKIKGWEDQKVFYYGHTRSWSQIGSAISSIIAAFIVFYSGKYSLIFLFSMIPYFLDLINLSSYPKQLDKNLNKFETKYFLSNMKKVFFEFLHSFKNYKLLKAMVNISIFDGIYKSTKDYLQPILKTFSISLPIFLFLKGEKRTSIVIGLVFCIIYILTSFASRYAGPAVKKLKNLSIALNLTVFIGLFFALLSGIFYTVSFYIPAIIFFVFIYLIQNFRKPMGIGYIGDVSDSKILSTSLSAQSQISSIFTAIISTILGFLADKFGIGQAITIIAIFFFLLFPIYAVKKL